MGKIGARPGNWVLAVAEEDEIQRDFCLILIDF